MGTIKATMQVLEPKKLEMRLSVVMTVEDWMKLKGELKPDDGRQLDHWHPAMQMDRAIASLIDKANESFYFYDSTDPE